MKRILFTGLFAILLLTSGLTVPLSASAHTAGTQIAASRNATCGDINGDGVTNTLDYNLLQRAYDTQRGDPNYNSAADLNHDGYVDALDYNILVRCWG